LIADDEIRYGELFRLDELRWMVASAVEKVIVVI
jgi:hypothetical protein